MRAAKRLPVHTVRKKLPLHPPELRTSHRAAGRGVVGHRGGQWGGGGGQAGLWGRATTPLLTLCAARPGRLAEMHMPTQQGW